MNVGSVEVSYLDAHSRHVRLIQLQGIIGVRFAFSNPSSTDHGSVQGISSCAVQLFVICIVPDSLLC
jgi:hypothetical protein